MKMAFRQHGKSTVYEIAYEYFKNGAHPLARKQLENMHIAHLCGHHSCVESRHLFLTTASLNQQMRAFHGTLSNTSSLETVWSLIWDNRSTHVELASKHSLSYHSVSKIRTGVSFKWLNDYVNRQRVKQSTTVCPPFPGIEQLFLSFLADNEIHVE